MVLKPLINKLLVLVSLLFLTSTVLLADLVRVQGTFLVAGEWVKGFAMVDKCYKIEPDGTGGKIIKAEQGWTIYNLAGTIVVGNGCVPLQTAYKEDKGGSGNGNNKIKNKVKIVTNNDGLDINFTEQLDIYIYDVSGKNVYIAKAQNNVFIGKNTLNLINGAYALHFVDKEGNEEIRTFIFKDGQFFLNTPKE